MPRHDRRPAPLPPLPPPAVLPHRRLWALRTERRISIDQLAELAGVRPATICELERGATQMPHRRTLAKLAAAYGMSLDELRRQIGMHGPLHGAPMPQSDIPALRRYSLRAEKIAGMVDTLPVEEQALIETLCTYFHVRRGVRLPDEPMEVER